MQLHIISTGRQTTDEFTESVKEIHPYVDYIHLRERNWTAKEHLTVIEKLIKADVDVNKIIINDRVDIAVTSGIKHVQLASHSIDLQTVKHHFPDLYVGCSVHSEKEAVEKEEQGAHFLIYGHIFKTSSKEGVPPRGVKSLEQVTSRVKIPVIAIGGISPGNIDSVLQHGASGIAVLSGILLANDSKKAVLDYRKKLKSQ